MADIVNNNIEANFELENVEFDAVFEINPSGAAWGDITGNIESQTDLQEALDSKANLADLPTVNDGVLTIQANGTDIATFSANQSGNTTANITIPDSATWGNITGTLSNQTDLQNKLDNKADLSDLPTVNNATITIQKNGSTVESFTLNQASNKTVNITVPTTASDVGALPNSTNYGASIDLSLSTTDYKLTLTLKDQNGNTLNSKVVDFPIESVVVSGRYDSTNKKIVLTLQNGTTIDIPVGDLVAGLQTEITNTNKLNADLVDDTSATNKFVTASEKTTWNNKQNALVSGTNIKTINNNSLLGSGNIDIQTGGTVDQTYDATSTNAQSGVAINGAGFATQQWTLEQASGLMVSLQTWVTNQGYLTSIPSGYVQNTATATNSLTILGTTNNQNNSILIGYSTTTSSTNSTVIGNTAVSGGSYATALGYYARANDQYTTAIGNSSYASYQDTTAVGHNSQATAAGTLAVGSNSKATAQRATSIGYSSQATQYAATSLGYEAKATASGALQIGTGTNSTANTLQVGSYTLLNTSTGLIPDARISSNFVTSSSLATTLSDYATQTWVGQQASALAGDLQTWVGNQGYLTSSDLSNYVQASNGNMTFANAGTEGDILYTDSTTGDFYGVVIGQSSTYGTGVTIGAGNSLAQNGYMLNLTLNGFAMIDASNMGTALLTVSNNNLAVNGSEVVTGDNTRFDGQWVMLSTAEVLLSTASIKDLSATPLPKTVTLPDDNHVYEVMIRGSVTTGTASGNYVELMCTSTECPETVFVCSARTRSNSAVVGQGTVIIPMKHGTDNLSIIRDPNYNGTANMAVIGYRRIGTNT